MTEVARTLTGRTLRAIGLALPVVTALASCGPGTGGDWNREAGAQISDTGFGNPTTNNLLYHSGQLH